MQLIYTIQMGPEIWPLALNKLIWPKSDSTNKFF